MRVRVVVRLVGGPLAAGQGGETGDSRSGLRLPPQVPDKQGFVLHPRPLPGTGGRFLDRIPDPLDRNGPLGEPSQLADSPDHRLAVQPFETPLHTVDDSDLPGRFRGMQQPPQGRLIGASDGSPIQVAAMLGTGQRDVQEAQLFRERLAPGMDPVLCDPARSQLQHRSVPVCGVVKHIGAFPVDASTPVPGEGAEYDRILEALALVYGHDLHQLLVALEAQLVLLFSRRVAVAAPAEPVHESIHRGAPGGRFPMQDLDQMPQIGQAPLAVDELEQTFGDLAFSHEFPGHGDETRLTPQPVEFPEAFHLPLQPLIVPVQVVDGVAVPAQQIGCERSPDEVGSGGFQRRPHHLFQFIRLRREEDVLLGPLDAVDSPQGQGAADHDPLPVTPYQHGDVATCQRSAGQTPLRGLGHSQELGHLGRGPADRLFTGQGLVQLVIEHADLQDRTVPRQWGRNIPAGRRPDPLETYLGEQEGFMCLIKERVHHLDQRRVRTPVDSKRVPVCRALPGPEVGKDVGAPEAVDRLLRVADQEHGGRASPIDVAEDLVLQRIRVLKLVDQGGRITFGNPGLEAPRLVLTQGPVEIEKQVVVGEQPPLSLAFPQFDVEVPDQTAQQRGVMVRAALLEQFRRRFQRPAGIEEGVGRRGRTLLHGSLERGAGELGELIEIRGRTGSGAEVVVHRLAPGVKRPRTVLAAVQPGTLEQQTHDFVPRIRPQLPHLVEEGREFGLQGLQGLRCLRAPDPEEWLTRPAGDLEGKALGRGLFPPQVVQEARRAILHMCPPEVIDDLLEKLLLIRQKLGFERKAPFEGHVGQCALAEAVNREYGGTVKIENRTAQPRLGRRGGAEACQQPLAEVIFADADEKGLPRLNESRPDSLPEFGRSGVGVGDDEDVLHLEFMFQQQAQVEGGDGVCLSRPGRRFNQTDPLEGRRQRIEPGDHLSRSHGA